MKDMDNLKNPHGRTFRFKSGMHVHVFWHRGMGKWSADIYLDEEYTARIGHSIDGIWVGTFYSHNKIEAIRSLRLELAKKLNPNIEKVHERVSPPTEHEEAHKVYTKGQSIIWRDELSDTRKLP